MDVVKYGGIHFAQFAESRPGVVFFYGDQAMNENQAEAKTEGVGAERVESLIPENDAGDLVPPGPGMGPCDPSTVYEAKAQRAAQADSDLTPPASVGAPGVDPEAKAKSLGEPGQPPLPRYECHKRVWALKIKDVWLQGELGGKVIRGLLRFEEPGHEPRVMSAEWMKKHRPKPGGRWVLYEDAYESFSPGEAFENGYTLMICGPMVCDGKHVIRDGKPTGEPVPHTAAPGMS